MLLLLGPLQEAIHKARPDKFSPSRKMQTGSFFQLGPTPAVIASLGGFRTVAADLLWLQMERVWDSGNWFALLPLLDAVVQLDPHFVLAWKVYGWHLAYNLNAESETIVDRKYWLDRGLEILQRAVEANPNSWEMVFELGWTYYDRAHESYRAAEYIKQADNLPGAPAYVTRMAYRVYEGIMDFDRLFPAMRAALKKHTDDAPHQKLVKRDIDWWTAHWNDPQEHRRQIVAENTKRQQRALPFYLYPDDPYWAVCPTDGLPSPKGSTVCQACGRPLPQTASKPTESQPAGG
jgi:tetratricopeptide (TPR) repeat protein